MRHDMKTAQFITLVIAGVWILLQNIACNKSDSQAAEKSAETAVPQVLKNGEEILFPPGSPQLEEIHTDSARLQQVQLSISAPAHIAASVVRSEFGTSGLFLFETQELTELYAEFVKAGSNADRASRQFERITDLKAHMAAAEKDVVDAEHEYHEAQADLAEKESRLRADGIDPKALLATLPGFLWILADIPESEISSVQLHSTAVWKSNSFPERRFTGHVAAIGDVVDPATRTLKIRVLLRNENQHLRPGMFGSVVLQEAVHKMLMVPTSAVIMVQGNSYVFEQTGAGQFRREKIVIEGESAQNTVVSSGIRDGEIVATDGALLLKGLSFGY